MTMENNKDRGREDVLVHLFEVLSEDQDVETLREALIHSGIDVDKAVTQGSELISSFLKRQKLARGRAKFERIKKALEDFRGGTTRSIEEARSAIAQAITGEISGPSYQVAHRKLESIAKEDLESLKDDAALIEFIAKIKEGDKEKE